jgi:hypothetical protein
MQGSARGSAFLLFLAAPVGCTISKKNETIDKRRHERCMRDPFKQFQLSSSTLRYSGLIVAVFVFHDDMVNASMFQDQISEQMFSS